MPSWEVPRKVMDLKENYVAAMPEAQSIFDFLERHYPKLVNAVENPLVPLTNNTVELAGYDISQIPIARILHGQLLGWPSDSLRELVPSV